MNNNKGKIIIILLILYIIVLLFVLKVFSKPKGNSSINTLSIPFSSNKTLKNTKIEELGWLDE